MAAIPATLGEALRHGRRGGTALPEHPEVRKHAAAAARESKVGLAAATEAITEALNGALEVKLIDILGRAWIKLEELQAYCEPVRVARGETSLVPLAEHTVRSVHQPAVEVLLGERVIGRMVLDVEASLSLEACVLKIRGGRIVGLCSGSFTVAGAVKLGGVAVMEGETPRFTIPGTIELGEGVEIPRLAVPA